VSSNAGPACIIYFISGNIIMGLYNHFTLSWKSYKSGRSFWNHQNIVKHGKTNTKNLIGFIAYCFNYLLIQNLAILTLYCAMKAKINVGVIITLWNISPLFMAILDYFIFREKLQCYHILGTICIIVCTIVLNLHQSQVLGDDEPTLPVWIPSLFGIVTPISFSTSAILAKHMTSEEVGFDPSNLQYSCSFIVNILLLFFALPYWSYFGFDGK
jgi:drug/metabolite transporter (DMT)-like permease